MRRFLAAIVMLIWGLWFGGVMALFLAVTSLFAAFADRHDVAGVGAARIFQNFNRYQLGLAATALLGSFAWHLAARSRLKQAVFALFALATLAAWFITMYLAPRIELLQAQGKARSPEFAAAHGYSMMAYVAEAALLLMAGLLFPWTDRT